MRNPLSEAAESKAELCHVPRKSFLQAEWGCRRKCGSPVLLFGKNLTHTGSDGGQFKGKMNIPSAEKEIRFQRESGFLTVEQQRMQS